MYLGTQRNVARRVQPRARSRSIKTARVSVSQEFLLSFSPSTKQITDLCPAILCSLRRVQGSIAAAVPLLSRRHCIFFMRDVNSQ